MFVSLLCFVSLLHTSKSTLCFQPVSNPPHLEARKCKVYKAAPRSRASEVKCPLVSVYFQHWPGPSLPGTRRAHIKLNKGQETTFAVTLPLRRPQTLGRGRRLGVGGGAAHRGQAFIRKLMAAREEDHSSHGVEPSADVVMRS